MATVFSIVVGGQAFGLYLGADAATGFAIGANLDDGLSFRWITEADVRAGVGIMAGAGISGTLYPSMPNAADVLGPQQGFGGDLGFWSAQKVESGLYIGASLGVGFGGLFDFYWFKGGTWESQFRDPPSTTGK